MKNISYLCKVKISIMKKFSFSYNDYSNPSVLGADKLWADGIDKLSRSETRVGDYHGI